jgi:coenzyme PQQ synthesis protein D (PqqD)
MPLADAVGMRDIDNDRLHPSPTVRAAVSADGLVLLDIRGGVLLASNLVGARIWRLVEQRQTVGDITSQLTADYGVHAADVQRDVAAFVAALADRGLVTVERRC